MNESLPLSLLYLAIALYLIYLYRSDLLVAKAGQPNPQALPGATQASVGLYVIGVGVSLIILALETFGEMGLGIAAEQSNVAWFFIITSLAAGIIEEIIFRGFLVIENRGQKLLIVSCVVFSAVFALLHPYLWQLNYPEGVEMWEFQKANFNITLTTKAWFTTAILFLNSLWFYALRFGSWNPNHSLFPCMLAHSTSNLGVFIVKWMQGHVIF